MYWNFISIRYHKSCILLQAFYYDGFIRTAYLLAYVHQGSRILLLALYSDRYICNGY